MKLNLYQSSCVENLPIKTHPIILKLKHFNHHLSLFISKIRKLCLQLNIL